MDPVLWIIAITSAGSIGLGVLYAYERWNAPRRAVHLRLEPGHDLGLNTTGVLRQQRRRFPIVDRLPISPEGRQRAQRDLDRAGVHWRVQEFLGLRLALAVILAVTAALALAGLAPWLRILFAAIAMIVGWALPAQYIARRRKRRMIAIEALLPDALTAISKSLRAGSGLLQALAFAADETPAPLGPELASALRDLQLGAEPVEVFTAFSDRVGSADLEIAVTAIIIQRTVGGNLSEILNNVTNTIRERAKIQREVRVLVTRQMLQANLTAALPVVLAALFIVISPDIGRTLITTGAGNVALAFAAVCEIAGIYTVRRLAVIEV
ncbi:MAG: type II secretion system F family protein [Chloroflexi bacterium]|nr:type II secretion system F family protein [Chloroflexota bacterium]